jgi:PadR family transcriptional regulator, regulatory protein PadR
MKKPQMTGPMLLVLSEFSRDPDHRHYGLELAHATGLAAGTIYPVLARLERYGWVTSEWEEIDPRAAGRRPRRYYQLTGDGHLAADTHLAKFRKEGTAP